MQLFILSLIAVAESQYDYFYTGDYDGDADLGIFAVRTGSATKCTEGTATDGLPASTVTCGDDEVCQVLVRYHTHPASGTSRAHYHNVCQSNIKTNAQKCALYSAGGRSLMAQCAGCCTGNMCDLYGPTFTPASTNVADSDQTKFGTLTLASAGK